MASDSFVFALLAFVFIVFMLFFAVLVTGMFFFIRRRENREGKLWANTAAQIGLQLKPASDEMLSDFNKMRNRMGGQAKIEGVTTAQTMFGNFSGRPVEVVIRGKRTSDHTAAYWLESTPTRVQKVEFTTCCEAMFANRSNFSFLIISRNYTNFIGRALQGNGDLQIGYEPFDRNFDVRGSDLQQIYRLLCTKTDGGRAIAESFAAGFQKDWIIEASNEKIAVKMRGKILNAARLSRALQMAAELAGSLENVLAGEWKNQFSGSRVGY